jgi:hypothetical protein
VAWASGPRDKRLTEAIVAAIHDRTGASERITFVTDCWEASETVVKGVYWEREASNVNPNWALLKPMDWVLLTQATKHRKGWRR